MGDSTCKRPCVGLLLYVLTGLSVHILPTASLDLTGCRDQLGMQSGEIPDSAVTASSSYDPDSVGPSNGRIRTEKNGGAWCPQNAVSKTSYEYLQIDLGRLFVVSMVETQGRFGNGQGQEFAKQYYLDYQREDNTDWTRFRDRQGNMVFQGNTNPYIAELRVVNPPIIAKRFRFVPFSDTKRTVCMRVELYGCPWKDGVISYKIPQGAHRGSEVNLEDFTYDGQISDNMLFGGLGQLMDGEEGQTNFRLDHKGLGQKGYAWVGWKNESIYTPPVEIVFKFDAIRNFTSMRIHCNNMFNKDVRVFRKAQVYFSIGGKYFYGEPEEFNYMRDTLIDFARPVIIPLHHHVGRFIKLLLYFDARWMLISEVQFLSDVVWNGNFAEEKPPFTTPPASLSMPAATDVDGDEKAAGVVEGAMYAEDNKTDRHKHMQGVLGAPLGTTAVSVLDRSKPHKTFDDQYIGVIIGTFSALMLLLFIIVLIFVLRQRRKKHNNAKVLQPRNSTLNLNDLRSPGGAKVSNGNMYNSVATSDMELERDGSSVKLTGDVYTGPFGTIQSRRLPELPTTPGSTDNRILRDYAVPDLAKSTMIVNIPPDPYYPHSTYGHTTTVPPQHRSAVHADPHYAASDIVDTLSIQGVSGNNVYAVPSAELHNLWKEDVSVMEFPRENLKFMEQLGEGQFGEVHLCEAMRITEFLGDDFLVNRTGSRSMLVAVKMLRKNVNEHAKRDFQKEVKIMARLKDPNIVNVLGMCTMDEPLCVIVEYMKFGDLHQFLQSHVLDTTLTRSTNLQTVSCGCLIYMASQIASGMKYLENLNMVHRDLATRNCLVGHNYTIKISDFGMSRSLYSTDYYRIEGRAVLPIRWMAWESILLGRFTTKSDIWSFGVTLWEIFNFAKEQPFNNLPDEQVIENCGHYYRNDGQQLYLAYPPHCPREFYDLMCECWNRNEAHRPAFKEIHMFLQRKNMGYNPKEEKMSKFNLPVV